jgi:polar amino acid transport system substrate-binding protein
LNRTGADQMEKHARIRTLLTLAIGLVAAFAVAGCGGDDSTSTSTDAPAVSGNVPTIESGKLIVGSDIPFPPFAQGNPPDYEGFDIDLINAVANKMGLETQIKDYPFKDILTGGNGRFDLAIAATTITPARAEKVDFSDPYFDSSQGLLVQSSSAELPEAASIRERDDIQTVDDLKDKIVGVQAGTTGEAYAQDNTDASEVRPFPQIDQAYDALKAGEVDGVISDLPSVEDAAKQFDGLKVVDDIPTDEQYGIVVPKGQAQLLDAVNSALQQVKEDGTLTDLYAEWFKTAPPEDLLQSGPAAVLGGDSTTSGG